MSDALLTPIAAVATGVVVIVVAIAVVLVVLFVTVSMRGRQRRGFKRRDETRRGCVYQQAVALCDAAMGGQGDRCQGQHGAARRRLTSLGCHYRIFLRINGVVCKYNP